MTRDDAIKRLREQAPALRAAGVHGLALFGSTARDEAGPESDVDVLVDVDLAKQQKFDLLALVGVQLMLTDRLGTPVHILLNGSMRERLKASLARDAIAVF